MSTRKGYREAPTRHALDWKNPAFCNKDACVTEVERLFGNCHGGPQLRQPVPGLPDAVRPGRCHH